MAKAMKRMGIQQQEIEAQQVIIRLKNKDLIFDDPQVSKVNMMGQQTWQVVGDHHEQERSTEADIKDEDIQTVMEQTGKTRDEAIQAIKNASGDLAQAILNLSE